MKMSCTICSSTSCPLLPVGNLELKLACGENDGISGINSTLSKEENVFFVVGNILQLSSSAMKELFVLSGGGGMSTWGLKLCPTCTTSIIQAAELFNQINTLIKEYHVVGAVLRGKVKDSDGVKINGGSSRKRKRTGRRTTLNGCDIIVERIRRNFTMEGDPQKQDRKENVIPEGGSEDNEAWTIIKSEPVDNNDDYSMQSDFYNALGEEGGFSYPDAHMPQVDEIDSNTERRQSLRKRSQTGADILEKDFELGDDIFNEIESDIEDDDISNSDHDHSSEDEENNGQNDVYRQDSEDSDCTSKDKKRGKKMIGKSTTRGRLPGYEFKRRYKCPHCKSSNDDELKMDVHILRMHRGIARPFPCDLCDRVFSTLDSALSHIDVRHSAEIASDEPIPHNGGVPNKTELEKRVSNDDRIEKSNMYQGIFQEEDNIEQSTPSNEQNTLQKLPKKSKDYVRKQQKASNNDLPFKCDSCPYQFHMEWLLTVHILRVHHGDSSPYGCDHEDCTRRFHRKSKLLRHRTADHINEGEYQGPHMRLDERIAYLAKKKRTPQPRPIIDIPHSKTTTIFRCTKCNVKLGSRIACKVHLKRAHEGLETKIKCLECDSHFLTETGKRGHYAKCHSKAQMALLSCNECGEEFTSQQDLTLHTKMKHLKTKEYMCELCPQVFTALRYLADHQRQVHFSEMGLEPLRCDICNKIFNNQRNLGAHKILAHTKEFPFKCSHCSRGFATKTALSTHIRVIHRNERYICTHCGKQFAQSYGLTVHLRTHTGEKPYKCQFCGKEYADKPTYSRHLQSHGDKVHVCPEPSCRKEFKIWHSFRLHCMKHGNSMVKKRPRKIPTKKQDEDDTDEDGNSSFAFAGEQAN